jgi:hypothetical protein
MVGFEVNFSVYSHNMLIGGGVKGSGSCPLQVNADAEIVH